MILEAAESTLMLCWDLWPQFPEMRHLLWIWGVNLAKSRQALGRVRTVVYNQTRVKAEFHQVVKQLAGEESCCLGKNLEFHLCKPGGSVYSG